MTMKKSVKQYFEDVMQLILFAVGIFLLIILVSTCPASAQEVQKNIQRDGNNFTQIVDKKKVSENKRTEYTYTDTKGNVYPIYLSSTGKAFIKRVSKKTGKEYPHYLPEVGKVINPEAYKEKSAEK